MLSDNDDASLGQMRGGTAVWGGTTARGSAIARGVARRGNYKRRRDCVRRRACAMRRESIVRWSTRESGFNLGEWRAVEEESGSEDSEEDLEESGSEDDSNSPLFENETWPKIIRAVMGRAELARSELNSSSACLFRPELGSSWLFNHGSRNRPIPIQLGRVNSESEGTEPIFARVPRLCEFFSKTRMNSVWLGRVFRFSDRVNRVTPSFVRFQGKTSDSH